MKNVRWILISIALVGSTPTQSQHGPAQTASPRETLDRYVAELQSNRDNRALREKIIRLAVKQQPPPTVSEGARRHFVKAVTLQKDAKAPEDLVLVIEEYEAALLLAPWFADAYYNLATAKDLSGNYEGARSDLNMYLLTNPKERDARQARDKLYEIEAKQEKAYAERERLAREKSQAQAARREIENKFRYVLGVWNEHTTRASDGAHWNELPVKFVTVDGGRVIESSTGRPPDYNFQPFLRGTVNDAGKITWEYWVGDPRTSDCPALAGWQPTSLSWGSDQNRFTFTWQGYSSRCDRTFPSVTTVAR